MAKNVFDKIADIQNSINRNNYDWSHDNNFTTAFGRVTPVFCQECPPNTSLKIKPTFGLKFLPMMFPVQTKVKAYLSFYRVPVRALWKDYTDFISSPNDPDAEYDPPYIDVNYDNRSDIFSDYQMFGVSGLADYLGVPVNNYVPNFSGDLVYAMELNPQYKNSANGTSLATWSSYIGSSSGRTAVSQIYNTSAQALIRSVNVAVFDNFIVLAKDQETGHGLRVGYSIYVSDEDWTDGSGHSPKDICDDQLAGGLGNTQARIALVYTADGSDVPTYVPLSTYDYFYDEGTGYHTLTMYFDMIVPPVSLIMNVDLVVPYVSAFFRNTAAPYTVMIGTKSVVTQGHSSFKLTKETSPYYDSTSSDNANQIKISAYPFRAYEAIYNAYMRNIRNNPFMLNGKAVYNKFITNNEGGKDTVDYKLYRANWASDAFTTAVPSPQQGQAPLVGITTYTEQTTLENGHTQNVVKFAVVDEDGKKYGLDFESNGEALKGVTYTELNSDTPVSPVSNLYDVVTSGISINDFRNVNAYQRYLELNMFRGYNYRDIIQGRFECNVHYDALLMPEYIGGFTRDVVINPVTQTVQTVDDGSYVGSLGSQSGDGVCFGQSDSSITVFCDEESIVMGLISVVPMPVYTQVLPKFFLYRDRLDTFNPEFDHIGFQPIYTSELAPIAQWNAAPGGMTSTVFGYQRPWYEYCQQRDTAHGLFRTQLRNFLINRVFDGVPTLGEDFTTVDPDQVNDVFSVTDISDKILGQIHFDMTAKLPISRVVVPKLE